MKKCLKQISAAMLAALLTVSAAACGGSGQTQPSPQESTALQETESSSVSPSTEEAPETTAQTAAAETSALPTAEPAPSSSAPPASSSADNGAALGITAQSAVLYDCASGNILVRQKMDNLVYPASTVKMLTALTVLRYVPLTDVVTVGEELNLVQPHSSLAYLAQGQQLTVDMLLHALLIPSGNDAAYTLAAYTGRVIAGNPSLDAASAVSVFVNSMNSIAAELGMKDSHFTNPDGYDDAAQQTTAYDLALLGAEFVRHPELTAITSLSSYNAVFLTGETISWENTNDLVNSASSSYVPECIGLKTGSSSYSGHCLVSAFNRGGHLYIAVVMNSSTAGRWSDSLILYQNIPA